MIDLSSMSSEEIANPGRALRAEGDKRRDIAVLSRGISEYVDPPPPYRTPLLDHRPELGQGEITLGDTTGGNLSRIYNTTSRGTDVNVILSGHYYLD